MGGGRSKPRPPPPPPRPPPRPVIRFPKYEPPKPIIRYNYVYYDVPSDAQQQINNIIEKISEKQRRKSDLQWELNIVRQNITNMQNERDYWISLSNKKQKEIDALDAEIAVLKSQIDDLNIKISKANQSVEIANEQINVGETAAVNLTATVTNSLIENSDTNNDYYKQIKGENDILKGQYDELRNDLTRGDTLSGFTDIKKDFYYQINWILFLFYFVLVVGLFVTFVLVPGESSIFFKGVIIIAAIIYPFLITTIENFVYGLVMYLKAVIMSEPYHINH
jgi:hypothetical protein